MGYSRAGFDEIVGVDITPQPRYPFTFVQADAMTYPLDGFDAIHASPPCQKFTVYGNNRAHLKTTHPDLIDPTRRRLRGTGVPWVIENVRGAPVQMAIQLCGSSFGMEIRRHRVFESNVLVMSLACAHERWTEQKYPGSTNRPNGRYACNIGEWRVPLVVQHRAMDIDWMTLQELSQAIPPAYTEYIGRQLLQALGEPVRGLRVDPVDGRDVTDGIRAKGFSSFSL